MQNITSPSFEALGKEMRAFYEPLRWGRTPLPPQNAAIRGLIMRELNAYANENPGIHPSLLKARQLEVMAEQFQAQIFPHSPFFFEMGLRHAENWGTPGFANGEGHLGRWMASRISSDIWQSQEYNALLYCKFYWSVNGVGFDNDHHCLGYTRLLRIGVNGQPTGRFRNVCRSGQFPAGGH